MKNLTTFVADKEIEINHASALSCGYGQKEITIEIIFNGNSANFTAKTNNVLDYDKACDLEGAEKYHAFYELIEAKIIDKIAEWLENIEE